MPSRLTIQGRNPQGIRGNLCFEEPHRSNRMPEPPVLPQNVDSRDWRAIRGWIPRQVPAELCASCAVSR
jgi:hypothetical protein